MTALLLALPACSRTHFVDHSAVLVRVNGRAITEAGYQHYLRARNRVAPVPGNPGAVRATALKEMVNTVVLAQQARRLGLENDPSVHFEMMQQRDYILARALFRRYLARHPVTTAELMSAYRRTYSDRGQVEYRVRQIVVHSRARALAIIRALHAGARFPLLAKRYSLDPAAARNEGETGWFTADRIAPSFASAVAALRPGEVGPEPVRTEFGWHVVELQGERMVPPPSFASAEPSLERQLVRARLAALIARLRSRARISH
ncbi:MAG: peptidylprolyl isomerase [Acidimicrobiales bacterium]